MPAPKRTNPLYQIQDILSRRDHSEYEIRQKMRKKGFSAEEITDALTWAVKHKLVNDHAFAHRYAESILNSKPVGRRYVSLKLRQRGISSQLISSVLEEVYSKYSEDDLMKDAAKRWQKSHPRSADDKQKLFRFLMSRGFTGGGSFSDEE